MKKIDQGGTITNMATTFDAYCQLLQQADQLSRNRFFALLSGKRRRLWRQVRRDRALAERLACGIASVDHVAGHDRPQHPSGADLAGTSNHSGTSDRPDSYVWLTVKEPGRVTARYRFTPPQFRFWQTWRREQSFG